MYSVLENILTVNENNTSSGLMKNIQDHSTQSFTLIEYNPMRKPKVNG